MIGRICVVVAIFNLLVGPSIMPASGAIAQGYTNVLRVLAADDTQFGGCMVRLETLPTSDCDGSGGQGWVSLDCKGEYDTKGASQRKMDLATLAMITGRQVQVFIDDTKKGIDPAHGFCTAVQFRLDR